MCDNTTYCGLKEDSRWIWGWAMDLQGNDAAWAGRFESEIEDVARVFDHNGRHEPFRRYFAGLLLPGNRESVAPMAARLAPSWATAEHHSQLHFVGQSPWSSEGLLAAVRASVPPAPTGRGPVEAWLGDCRNRARGCQTRAIDFPTTAAKLTAWS